MEPCMASLGNIMISNTNSNLNKGDWVEQIRNALDEKVPEGSEFSVSIFNVPKTLMQSAWASYIPRQVALGPYHQWSSELYGMERYKIDATRRVQKHLYKCRFQDIVDELKKEELSIRACYHKYLDFDDDILAWMMAVDVSFLLQFLLHFYAAKEGKAAEYCSKMSHLFELNIAGKKAAASHNDILGDVIMLENQIPLFLLTKVFQSHTHSQFSSPDSMPILFSMVMGLCEELCPFKKMNHQFPQNVSLLTKRAHLLDFLYHMIVPAPDFGIEIPDTQQENEGKAGDQSEGKEGQSQPFGDPSYVQQFFQEIWKILKKLNIGPVRVISKPVRVISNMPWQIISKAPPSRKLVEKISSSSGGGEGSSRGSCDDSINNSPLVEEITIPSVTSLSKAGVRFRPLTNSSICAIRFDLRTATLYLPRVSLDVHTEVVFRNLVAYEACQGSCLVLARYSEIMNGIVDAEEDAKLLISEGIIENHLKTNKEVTNLWNGMSKSVRLTKVRELDKAVKEVNDYYDSRWSVRAGKFLKIYVFASWKLLTFLATLALLLLMSLQAFCSVYNCARLLHVPSALEL